MATPHPMSQKVHPAYRGRWPTVRKAILERDQYQCQIQGPRCTGLANTVDHIIPVQKGGAWWDPDNLRAACAKCNDHRIDRTRNEAWRNADTHIVLVAGPPAAGKTTWVQEHARPGDLIVDYDAIATSLGANPHQRGDALHPAINAARNAILRSLRQGSTGAATAYILSANPEAEQRFPHHELVLIDPGQDTAIRNARAAGRPSDYIAAILDWYRRRQSVNEPTAPSRDW